MTFYSNKINCVLLVSDSAGIALYIAKSSLFYLSSYYSLSFLFTLILNGLMRIEPSVNFYTESGIWQLISIRYGGWDSRAFVDFFLGFMDFPLSGLALEFAIYVNYFLFYFLLIHHPNKLYWISSTIVQLKLIIVL